MDVNIERDFFDSLDTRSAFAPHPLDVMLVRFSDTQIFTPRPISTISMAPNAKEINRIKNGYKPISQSSSYRSWILGYSITGFVLVGKVCHRVIQEVGHNKELLEPQDVALKDYIVMLYASGLLASKDAVAMATDRLLYYFTGNPNDMCLKR